MQSKLKDSLFFIAFVCGHKDTTIFVITKIVIYLYRKYLDYYCARAQKTMSKTMNTPERIRIKDIAKMADVSVGTVDRVIHGRSGVSEASRKRVEEILEKLNYQPNMYASALASNKKYAFACLLPQHETGEYWTEVESGIHEALTTYSDFNITVKLRYYDPYDYRSFAREARSIVEMTPDGVLFAPTAPQYTTPFTDELEKLDIPYIYIDSNIKEEPALSFYGQNSHQSGYFAARMLMLLAGEDAQEIVIFRKNKRRHRWVEPAGTPRNRFPRIHAEASSRLPHLGTGPACQARQRGHTDARRVLPRASYRKERNHLQLQSIHHRRVPAKTPENGFQPYGVRPAETQCGLPERRKHFLPYRPTAYPAGLRRHQSAMRSPDSEKKNRKGELHAD